MLSPVAPLLLTAATAVTIKTSVSSNGCDALSKNVPNTIFYRGDDVYEYESKQFWSNNELMDPECVFRPTSADEVAQAVQIMQDTNTQFAVRGGGHMAIKVRTYSYTYSSRPRHMACFLKQPLLHMNTLSRDTIVQRANESHIGFQQHR